MEQKNKILAITGGLGSGKTTVCKLLEQNGIPIYYADQAAKTLMQTDIGLKAAIEQSFGNESYINETLNKQYLSKIVFNNPEKLQELNKIVHPAVQHDFTQWKLNQKTQHGWVGKEAAILIESGTYKDADFICLIICPIETRINRVMQRDNINRKEVLARMDKQWSDDAKIKFAHFVLTNDGKKALEPQIEALLGEIGVR